LSCTRVLNSPTCRNRSRQLSVGGIRVVKAFANEDHERDLFARNNEGYRATKLNDYAYMTASITLRYFSTRFVQLVVMISGTWFVISG
ncbi:ABC transporter transmembrane domain-containing protein, partial [Rhizobium leguminosarum]|uniref:ABC transporter transmembrane domain-containing protein n=1 Tax=Rhizobium leguminosarum TaxID=384 RepID=UPI003F9C0E82